jgi:hypothetical protein
MDEITAFDRMRSFFVCMAGIFNFSSMISAVGLLSCIVRATPGERGFRAASFERDAFLSTEAW